MVRKLFQVHIKLSVMVGFLYKGQIFGDRNGPRSSVGRVLRVQCTVPSCYTHVCLYQFVQCTCTACLYGVVMAAYCCYDAPCDPAQCFALGLGMLYFYMFVLLGFSSRLGYTRMIVAHPVSNTRNYYCQWVVLI